MSIRLINVMLIMKIIRNGRELIRKIINEINSYGNVEIVLKEFLDKNNITRNALASATNIRYGIIDNYYKNKVARIDLYTLAKICYVLINNY